MLSMMTASATCITTEEVELSPKCMASGLKGGKREREGLPSRPAGGRGGTLFGRCEWVGGQPLEGERRIGRRRSLEGSGEPAGGLDQRAL